MGFGCLLFPSVLSVELEVKDDVSDNFESIQNYYGLSILDMENLTGRQVSDTLFKALSPRDCKTTGNKNPIIKKPKIMGTPKRA